MGNVLPKETGLTVNGVVYQYTPVKNPADPLTVSVQNQNAMGAGFIFRETDDWSGKPGIRINKFVPVDNIPIQYWGDGAIQLNGAGSVQNPNVVYTYRIDECFDPQSNAACPGYKPKLPDIPAVELTDDTDPLSLTARQTSFKYESKKSKQDAEGREAKEKAQALKDAEAAIELGNGVSQAAVIQSMNFATNIKTYYSLTLNGGVYKDALVLVDSKLSENRHALRNGLAQQLLHQKMVDQQYKR